MRNPRYRYNPSTCRYERSTISFGSVAGYSVGLLVTAALMFTGIILLHDFLVDSEKEISLRRENVALQKHQAILTSQLNEIETTLAGLQQKDRELHNKFFITSTEESLPVRTDSRRAILLSDASDFRQYLEDVGIRSARLLEKSTASHASVEEKLRLEEGVVKSLASIPTALPVETLDAQNLLSGFGLRINPFHKGLYDHPGIDITMPRGTPIKATAAGMVLEVKRSDLQAGYGNYIEIDHGHGYITRYAHLEEIHVRAGQKIESGTVIATSGNSGGSVAPHLHYEIIRNGVNVDPVQYLIAGVTSLQHQALRVASQKQNQSLD